jgi:predicted glycogen debranching enzyme
MIPQTALARADITSFESASRREWLVTNGLGGFASGTVAGANTRRYHGLLVAALKPPVQRSVLVSKLDVTVRSRGCTYELACNEYADGTVAPHGHRHLEGFMVDGLVPTWTWALGDAQLVQRIWMAQGANATYVTYTLSRATADAELEIIPLCTGRDYHGHARGKAAADVRAIAGGVEIAGFADMPAYRVVCDRGAFKLKPDTYWRFAHRVERERGLDDTEDLLRPGVFRVTLRPGETVTFLCATADVRLHPDAGALAAERTRTSGLLGTLPATAPAWIRRLALAADQFVVRRDDGGASVIAGYPWFADWGRDTMIALPGLALATGRPRIAAQVLRTFAAHMSEGMLPNRFPDAGEPPEYNTVDATLWYFHAVERCVAHGAGDALARDLYPVLNDIVDWHRRGTRYGIAVDERDGLLRAGEPGVQLTWMDAKVGDRVVTPRTGKSVEINALWHNALATMATLAKRYGDRARARDYASAAARVRESFNARFWNAAAGCLYDVVDVPGASADASVRPNQIFAVSLPHPLLDASRARAVVDTCARELWTPVGLRSLAPGDPGYAGRYAGGPNERDGVYHQGTAWSWLLGPFALAHLAAFGDAARALAWLEPVAAHLADACVGQISEIFDGDAPHAPAGCFAQAWSVAEVLRAWFEITRATASAAQRGERHEGMETA